MTSPEQIPLFDLPPVDETATKSAPTVNAGGVLPQEEAMHGVPLVGADTSKRAKQLSLDVKFYVVISGNDSFTVQARSPTAAKYLAFKRAREAGLYLYEGGFPAFVGGGIQVRELRK